MKQSKSKWISLVCLTALSGLQVSQTLTAVQAETTLSQEQVKQETSAGDKGESASKEEAQPTPVAAQIYTVKFHGNTVLGVNGIMQEQTLELDKDEKLNTNIYTLKGYTFLNWNTHPNGIGTSYGDGASVRNIAAAGATLDLYAQWRSNSYTVQFHSNDGMNKTSAQKMAYALPDLLNENKFTRDGYAFDGWNTKADGTGKTYADKDVVEKLTDKDNGTVNLYAIWKALDQTITFDSDGGSAVAPLTAKTGSQVDLDQYKPTKQGYTLDGWLDDKGNVYKGKITMPAGGLNLKANWKANSYKLHFEANGGTGNMPDQDMTYDAIAPLNTNTFTRTGYKLIGWSTNPDGTGDTYLAGSDVENLTDKNGETINLYAIWAGNPYTITFNANGGTGNINPQAMTYGTEKKLSANTFTRDGYEFIGWNTQADGKGKSYANGISVKDLTDVENGNVQLYAQWKQIPVPAAKKTISFDVNGGDESSKPKDIEREIGSTFNLDTLAKPTRMGYRFTGWYDDQGNEYKGEITIPANDLKLKAGWEANTYKVTYQSNGGSSVSSDDVTFEALIKEPTAPTREGYTFKGWYSDADFKTEWHFGQDKMPANDLTLYAKWEKNATTEDDKGQNTPTPDKGHSQDKSNANFTTKQAQEKSNKEKLSLPVTGSTDTALITTIGSSILGLAALAFVSRRRKDKKGL